MHIPVGDRHGEQTDSLIARVARAQAVPRPPGQVLLMSGWLESPQFFSDAPSIIGPGEL